MCRLHTEGTKYGCGHYIITLKVLKADCLSRFCVNSTYHQDNCPHCPNCKRYYDPDASEKVTSSTSDYCRECDYWFKGEGARRSR